MAKPIIAQDAESESLDVRQKMYGRNPVRHSRYMAYLRWAQAGNNIAEDNALRAIITQAQNAENKRNAKANIKGSRSLKK